MSEEPEKLVGLSEVAELLEVSRQRASQVVAQEGFPEPFERLRMGPIWKRGEILRWKRLQER